VNSQTCQDLNQRYFAGRLPRYPVIVAPQLHHASGRIARRSRRIYLQLTFPDVMLQILLHEMAHASTNDHHGPLWRAEMQRLQALGAPVEEPTSDKERIPLTRQLVCDAGYDAFFSQPELSSIHVARWLQHEYGFSSGHSLMQAYPWVTRVLHEARQEATEHRARRERQLAAQHSGREGLDGERSAETVFPCQ
jgi:hypothetical protein